MIKILFICHGNICRSPMAEFVMKSLAASAGLEREFDIASAATSSEELGNPVYPQARRKLAEHGIGCAGKTARRLTAAAYGAYDRRIGVGAANLVEPYACKTIIENLPAVMERYGMENLTEIIGGAHHG